MKILLVEDEDRSIRQAIELIDLACPGSIVTVAQSRDAANGALGNDAFDLILCDLRIPPSDGSVDINENHGLAVHAKARDVCPGTPLIFLTAFATTRNTREQLSSGGTQVLYGMSEFAMVQMVEKDELDELQGLLQRINNALDDTLNSCQVDSSGPLDEMFLRAVASYGKSMGMERAEVFGMPGGLSGAPLGRITYSSPELGSANVFMKVVPHVNAVEESANFNALVPPRLQLGHYAHSLPPIVAGLRDQAALVSSLADGCVSLFELLRQDVLRATAAVVALREAVRPWTNDSAPTPMKISDLRRIRLPDEKLSALEQDLGAVLQEHGSVEIKKSICHGDLHGENILVTRDGRPVLIDFGDLGVGYAPIDPITLELSIVFHKGGPARDSDWANSARWDRWADVDRYVESSPFEPFIRECRAWAIEENGAPAVNGVAYAHAMRQLKYDDVDSAIALAIASSALHALKGQTS